MTHKGSLEYKEKMNNLEKYILSKPYGTTLTFNELNEFVGEDLKDEYGKIRFKSFVGKVKKRLHLKGYVLRNVNSIGYYILKPNQIAGFTYRNYIVKPIYSFNRAKVILSCAEKNKLNQKEKQIHNKTEELNSAMISAFDMLVNDEDYTMLKGE